MPKCHQKVITFGAKIDHESHQKLRRKTTRTNTENKTSSEQKRHETERARSRINTKNNGFYWFKTKAALSYRSAGGTKKTRNTMPKGVPKPSFLIENGSEKSSKTPSKNDIKKQHRKTSKNAKRPLTNLLKTLKNAY